MPERLDAPHMIYAGIRVRELGRSVRFYRVLGLKKFYGGEMAHGGVYVWLRDARTKQILELNYCPAENKFHVPYASGSELDHIGFTVRDVEPVLARLRRAGVRPVADFVEGHTRLTFVKDPDGIWVEFLSWTPNARKFRDGAPALSRVMSKSKNAKPVRGRRREGKALMAPAASHSGGE